jgi:hypothetical protein
VNEENVLRFRHECFLMKNLSHPNVVQLVGVCWSEDLFACCLEFVENGSLEDWLRRTVGGKKFEAAKGKDELLAEKRASFKAKVYWGFNPENADHSALFTNEDVEHATKTKQRVEELAAAFSATTEFEKTWEPVLRPDGSPLAHGAKAFTRYAGRSGESFNMIEINAKPAQIMAYHTDASRLGKEYKGFDVTAATRSLYARFDQKTVGVSNRDALTRSAITTYPDGSIMESARSIEDKR